MGVGTSGRREDMGKGCKNLDMVQILCTRYINGKMRPVETTLEMQGGEIKENDRGGEFKYDIFDIF
jgi:hypothetical protein